MRRLLFAAVATAPLAAVTMPAAAEQYWSGWTFTSDDRPSRSPGAPPEAPLFDQIVVTFDVVPGAPFAVPDFSSVPIAEVIAGPGHGYTITFKRGVEEGDVFNVEFTAPTMPTFIRADFYRLGEHVGWMGLDGVVKTLEGVKIGEITKAIAQAIDALVAEWQVVLKIIDWGLTLSIPPGGGFMAHANTMADLYAPDATLLPTLGIYALYRNGAYVANDRNAPVIRNYFRHVFLPKRPIMMPLNLGTLHVTVSTDTTLASANGFYTFLLFGNDCGGWVLWPKVANARFTFVFKKVGGQWKIIQHHSSQDPSSKNVKPQKRLGCVGDLNWFADPSTGVMESGDGLVDGDDLAILLGAWGSETDACIDLDGDGIVDAEDLSILLGAWGPCP